MATLGPSDVSDASAKQRKSSDADADGPLDEDLLGGGGPVARRPQRAHGRTRRTVDELAEITKRLALVVRPESIPVWLQRPILALDDEKPIELIARGEYRKVAKLIAEIEYPGIS